jgi:acid phosphatase class B
VRRTIAISDEDTLADLHRALQVAFGWDDGHLYAFWLGGKYWGKDETTYVHPLALEAASARGHELQKPRRRSADRRLARLHLRRGQRIAYVFDFAAQWRVRLTLREIAASDGGPYPRVVETIGDAPPQNLSLDELAKAA